tara:strand:+ start:2974 stop:3252 length:279 start_codon:yes stop_codon:yes gene_type:complete
MSSPCSFIYEEKDEYIILNDENIRSIELEKGLINIYKHFIPKAPILPEKLKLRNTTVQIKIKTRFNNFDHYKKHLKNKRKRQRRKKNKLNKF